MPTIIEGIFGFPTIVLNLDRGASSPERPTLQLPEPLSITTQVLSIFFEFLRVISYTNDDDFFIQSYFMLF